jgi:hypothetical protein
MWDFPTLLTLVFLNTNIGPSLLEKRHLVKEFHFGYWYIWSETQLGKRFHFGYWYNWSEKFIDKYLSKIPLRFVFTTEAKNKHGGTLVITLKFCFKDFVPFPHIYAVPKFRKASYHPYTHVFFLFVETQSHETLTPCLFNLYLMNP